MLIEHQTDTQLRYLHVDYVTLRKYKKPKGSQMYIETNRENISPKEFEYVKILTDSGELLRIVWQKDHEDGRLFTKDLEQLDKDIEEEEERENVKSEGV